jgi:hypothetical protein
MILALGISIQASSVTTAAVRISRTYEFDAQYWNAIEMRWEMINDTWETE